MTAESNPTIHTTQPVRIEALGCLELHVSGRDPHRRGAGARARKPLDLLMGLVAAGPRGIAQPRLCEALWPESEGDAAYRALITTVYRLRRLLECHHAVQFLSGRLALDAAHCWVDAWSFETDIGAERDATGLRPILALYRGPLFGDFDSPLVFESRDRLRRKFVRATLLAAQQLERSGARAAAIDLLQHAIDADSGCEDLHRELICALARDGQLQVVASAYKRCRAALLRQFGIVPSPATERAWREACVFPAGPRHAGFGLPVFSTN